jgi:hypothetical protein
MARLGERLEVTDPAGYRQRMFDLVGSRDRFTIMADSPRVLNETVSGTRAAVLRSRPFADKWTPTEILGHLVDAEFIFGYRTRAILCDDRPRIIGMDQEAWVREQRYNDRDPGELVAAFAALRGVNMRLWRSIGTEQLNRIGIHSERGEESLDTMLTMIAGHDLSHIDQLRRYIAAAEADG